MVVGSNPATPTINIKMKIILVSIFVLSSCSGFGLYITAVENFNQFFKENKIDKEYAKSIPYASYLVSYQKSEYLLVLEKVNNNFLTWVDAESNRLISLSDKMIKSHGLSNNFEIIQPPNLQEIVNRIEIEGNLFHNSYITFTNPPTQHLKISYKYKIERRNIEESNLVNYGSQTLFKVVEEFSVPTIKWKGNNYYLVNKDGLIIKSVQNLYPGYRLEFEKIRGYKAP